MIITDKRRNHYINWGFPAIAIFAMSMLFQKFPDYWCFEFIAGCLFIWFGLKITAPGPDVGALNKALPAMLKTLELDREGVRAIIWVPYTLHQLRAITRYYPTQERPFEDLLPIRSGIVGKAYVSKKIQGWCCEDETSNEDYRQELVDDWNFSSDEADKLSLNKRAFLAIPVVENGTVRGIIYCDSADVSPICDHSDSDFQRRALAACELIAPYIREVD